MTTHYYTDEKAVQIVISLLKQHGIRKVVASPGSTNATFIFSIQGDPFFEIFSAVDERSAAYMACGIAFESNEPVVISCTAATSYRNYYPALTEAYYRKLPIIAIASSRSNTLVGHLVDQVTDRTVHPKDVSKYNTIIPIVKDINDVWHCEIEVNKAILETKRHGGGPVIMTLENTYSRNYDVHDLPIYNKINRITSGDCFPTLIKGKIAILIGSHVWMTNKQVELIDGFCETNNAVVLCSHLSGYHGKYKMPLTLIASQKNIDKSKFTPDLLIHIGEISGTTFGIGVNKEVWRVSPDGEIRDTFKKLKYVFEMTIDMFFAKYQSDGRSYKTSYLNLFTDASATLRNKIPELPFSNIWIASLLAAKIPCNTTMQFGILGSLRAWNFFDIDNTINVSTNVGGYGIDGCVSTLVGASLYDSSKLNFLVIGDLAFFYDMNAIGNRHIGNNVRILIVNNGKGAEFRLSSSHCAIFGDLTDEYVSAGRHFGNKSPQLVKSLAESLGYEYISANTKEEFIAKHERFVTPEITDAPMIFEVFTEDVDETKALDMICNIEQDIKSRTKDITRKILGEDTIKFAKKILKK